MRRLGAIRAVFGTATRLHAEQGAELHGVVGVVGNVKNLGLAESEDAVYDQYNPNNDRTLKLVVRSRAGTGSAGMGSCRKGNCRCSCSTMPTAWSDRTGK